MRPRQTVLLVLGIVAVAATLGLLAIGAPLLWAHTTQRDDAGFYTLSSERLATPTYAIFSERIDVFADADGGRWDRVVNQLGTIRVCIDDLAGKDMFVGIEARAGVRTDALGPIGAGFLGAAAVTGLVAALLLTGAVVGLTHDPGPAAGSGPVAGSGAASTSGALTGSGPAPTAGTPRGQVSRPDDRRIVDSGPRIVDSGPAEAGPLHGSVRQRLSDAVRLIAARPASSRAIGTR